MSSPKRFRRVVWCSLAAAVSLAAVGLFIFINVLHGPSYGLPYSDQFEQGRGQGWTAYGGTWQIADGAMQNVSDERGAKLLIGSTYWRDYTVDADLRLDGESGDAGLLLRVQEPDEGVDAFRGFYTGLRLRDNSLIAGDADYGWVEQAPQPLATQLVPFQWYHLQASIWGCHLRVRAFDEARLPLAKIDVVLPSCSPHGQVGLRSYASGGSWKKVRVSAIKEKLPESVP